VLIKSGRADEAYHRYGLKAAVGPTYLAIFRETIERYPERDRRQVLLNLIETRGDRGKWFAAAKDAGFLVVALACARADPATLVRAARDFAAKEPKFAADIGVVALARLLKGRHPGGVNEFMILGSYHAPFGQSSKSRLRLVAQGGSFDAPIARLSSAANRRPRRPPTHGVGSSIPDTDRPPEQPPALPKWVPGIDGCLMERTGRKKGGAESERVPSDEYRAERTGRRVSGAEISVPRRGGSMAIGGFGSGGPFSRPCVSGVFSSRIGWFNVERGSILSIAGPSTAST
jgi:hypothetical protein